MLKALWREILRLRGELTILGISILVFYTVGLSRGNFEIVVYKLGLLAVASIAVHISRQLSFDYICIEAAIRGEDEWKKVPVPIRCVVVGGMLFLYTILVYAILVAG